MKQYGNNKIQTRQNIKFYTYTRAYIKIYINLPTYNQTSAFTKQILTRKPLNKNVNIFGDKEKKTLTIKHLKL